jgi:two-component system, OmpR family, response regulator
MKVLIIDDEADIRRIARLSLTRVGKMDVVEAGGGEAGVREAEDQQPDVILLDVMMPAMDGPATLAALKANPRTAAIPVLFLTAKALGSEIERLRSLGAEGVLTKPFDPLGLPELVQAAVRRT